MEDKLQEWLIGLIQGIVSHPEHVVIENKKDEMGLLFTIKVHGEDRGKLIGREGKHANALRTLLHCAGGNFDVRAALRIDVPIGKSFHKSLTKA